MHFMNLCWTLTIKVLHDPYLVWSSTLKLNLFYLLCVCLCIVKNTFLVNGIKSFCRIKKCKTVHNQFLFSSNNLIINKRLSSKRSTFNINCYIAIFWLPTTSNWIAYMFNIWYYCESAVNIQTISCINNYFSVLCPRSFPPPTQKKCDWNIKFHISVITIYSN